MSSTPTHFDENQKKSSFQTDVLRKRYAYNWNTLPKYVFQKADGVWDNFEYIIINGPVQQIIDPWAFYKTVNQNTLVPLELRLDEICFFYVFFNPQFRFFMESYQNAFQYLQEQLHLTDDVMETIRAIWTQYQNLDHRNQLIRKINSAKIEFKKAYDKYIAEETELSEVGYVPFTSFVTESVQRTYSLDENVLVGNVQSLFDSLTVSETFPLITIINFSKVLVGFDYTVKFPPRENVLYMFYTGGIIEIKITSNVVEISFEQHQNESDEEILTAISKALGLENHNFLHFSHEKLNGFIWFPNQRLSGPIWQDLILLHPTISQVLYIQENCDPQVSQVDPYHLHFLPDPSLESADRIELKIKPHDGFEGLRLHLYGAKNEDAIRGIQFKISNFFALYNKRALSILKEYNQLLGAEILELDDSTSHPCPETSTPTPLAPEAKLMMMDYTFTMNSKDCKFFPSVSAEIPGLSTQDLHNSKTMNPASEMEFPRKDDDSKVAQIIPKRFYSCKIHHSHPFIGLRKNTNPIHKDEFPLIPCCFQQDQRSSASRKKLTLWQDYFQGKKNLDMFATQFSASVPQEIRFLYQKRIPLASPPFQPQTKCPKIIAELFSIFMKDPSEASLPVRIGVDRSPVSILSCILYALNKNNFRNLKSPEDRTQVVENELKTQFKGRRELMNLCAQECWNLSTPEDQISTETFFNPRHFIRALERVYSCRCVLLGMDDFIKPNHVEGYLRWGTPLPMDTPIVILFENYGEAVEFEYPQYEWIVSSSDAPDALADSNIEANPPTTENKNVYEKIYGLYLSSLINLRPSGSFDPHLIKILERDYKVSAQHIDYYGKVFAFDVEIHKEKVTLFLSETRLPPVELPRVTTFSFPKAQQQESQQRSDSLMQKISVQIQSLQFHYFNSPFESSYLSAFETKREQIELLIENAKHILSNLLLEKNPKLDPSLESIPPGSASSKNIVIPEDWQKFILVAKDDGQLPTVFHKFLFTDLQEIVVSSEEVKRRLVFMLELELKRDPKALLSYAKPSNDMIPFKYRTTEDFVEQPNAFIADRLTKISWYRDFWKVQDLSDLIYESTAPTQIFVCQLQNRFFKCSKVSDKIFGQWAGKPYRVYFPQNKQIFWVTAPQARSRLNALQGTKCPPCCLIILKTIENHVLYYQASEC